MKRLLPLVLAAGLSSAVGAEQAQTRPFAEGTRVVVVGPITSQPRDAGVAVENKLQIGIGPEKRDYTLHIKDAQLFGFHGNRLEKRGLRDKMWVRAEGTVMDDPKRIKVDRLQVVGNDLPGLQRSAFYRPGFDQGYVMAVGGLREIYPESSAQRFPASPLTMIAQVSDDTGALERTRKLQVRSAGNKWTLHVNKDAAVVDGKGEKISVHEIKEGQWVRVTGWMMDDLRMRVTRVENIGPDAAFRTSQYFKPEFPLGYVDRLTGVRDDGKPVNISGTVTYIDTEGGYFTVRDAAGKEHAIYAELAEVRRSDQPVRFGEVKSGDVVVVDIRHIQF